jgi:hypothetical protein
MRVKPMAMFALCLLGSGCATHPRMHPTLVEPAADRPQPPDHVYPVSTPPRYPPPLRRSGLSPKGLLTSAQPLRSLGSGDGVGRRVYLNNLILAYQARQSRTVVAEAALKRSPNRYRP